MKTTFVAALVGMFLRCEMARGDEPAKTSLLRRHDGSSTSTDRRVGTPAIKAGLPRGQAGKPPGGTPAIKAGLPRGHSGKPPVGTPAIKAGLPRGHSGKPERGYQLLRTRPYLPSDFDDETFDNLWTVWPAGDRAKVEQLTKKQRRAAIFQRYGLTPDPENGTDGMPLGYLKNESGGWVMNCLACHGGEVAGQVIPGLGNARYGLQSLVEDGRLVKFKQLKRPTHMDVASMKMPLGTSHGTTNAVVFGVVLAGQRDIHMNVDRSRKPPKQLHHDMDAPAWWNVKYKKSIYIDGFAPKNHRVIMQFVLLPVNSAEQVKKWENDFLDVLAWIESLEPPKYPFEVDQGLAKNGRKIFNSHCADCHGTYGGSFAEDRYPEKLVSIGVVKTDPVRLHAIDTDHRKWMSQSWMTRYGKDKVRLDNTGYVAPPLRGVWATAPYLHNGSVPTLWHLMNSSQRPLIWQRVSGFDRARNGPNIVEFDELPKSANTPYKRRLFFDTRKKGKSASGHNFPDALSADEKAAVLEYLKTL